MKRRLLATFILLSAIMGLLVTDSSQAAFTSTLRFELRCSGFTSQGGGVFLNRDNTGVGREEYIVTALDGFGNVIYEPQTESFLINEVLEYTAGRFFAWTTAPVANPLVLTMTSKAGNGYEAERFLLEVGNCPTLTQTGDLASLGLDVTLLPADGEVSPSVALNASPPTPPLQRGLATTLGLPGFAFVNVERLNMRSGDGVQYTVVGILNGGTELIVLGKNAVSTWWYVQADDLRGWVRGELVLLRGDLTDVPEVAVEGELRQPSLVLYDDYPLYLAPNTTAPVLCTATGNLEYQIIGRDDAGEWYQLTGVCADGSVTGWIQADLGGLRNPAELRIPVTD